MDPRRINKILIVIIILLLVGGAYYMFKSKQNLSTDSIAEIPESQPAVITDTATPSEEIKDANAINSPEAGKTTYANTKYAFEFTYPSDWQLANCPSCSEADTQASSIAFNSPGGGYAVFAVEVVTTAKCSGLKACAEANRKVFSNDQTTTGLIAYDHNGENGLSETINRPQSGDWKYIVYYFMRDKNLYTVSLHTKSEDETQTLSALTSILSTFKITAVDSSVLKTYSDTKEKFSIGHPADGNIAAGGPKPGIRFDNFPANRPDNYTMKAGDYYIEVNIEDSAMDCSKQFASSRKIVVDGVAGLRGPAVTSLPNYYPYMLCFNKEGKTYLVSAVEYDDRQERPKNILDSFHFIK